MNEKSNSRAMTLERVAAIYSGREGAAAFRRGDSTASAEIPRMAAGVFILTYATGGGYPLWRATRLKGPTLGGKSSVAANAVYSAETLCWRCFNVHTFCTCSEAPLRMKSVYADVEGVLDESWLHAVGASPDGYYLPDAADGGEMIDKLDLSLMADDCGLVVIDSLAMLLPGVETDRATGDPKVGSQAQLLTRGVMKLTNRLRAERRRGHPCLVLAINQIRAQLQQQGPFRGGSNVEAGPYAVKHWSALGIHLGCKADKSIKTEAADGTAESHPMSSIHYFRIDRNKVPITTKTGEFVRITEPVVDDDIVVKHKGAVDDGKTLITYAKRLGLFERSAKGFRVPGVIDDYHLAGDLPKLFVSRPDVYLQLQITTARRALGKKEAGGARLREGIA